MNFIHLTREIDPLRKLGKSIIAMADEIDALKWCKIRGAIISSPSESSYFHIKVVIRRGKIALDNDGEFIVESYGDSLFEAVSSLKEQCPVVDDILCGLID